MSGDEHRSARTDDEALRGTVACEKTVLLVARTITSTSRLLDVPDLFRGDFRVRFVFTVHATSQFSDGVHALLNEAWSHPIVPWSRVNERPYDLAISASEQIDVDTITGPVVVLPHGIGFNKYVPDSDGPGARLAGLPPAEALRTGRVRVVLSHPEQDAQLRAASPDIAGHTVVTGDPTYDRLLASRPLRERYRRSVDAEGRTVVLLSSTWRPESALGQWRELPRRLLAELPADDYRVCAALHPNIWARYGPVVVRTWLADCLDAGLRLVPPTRGWQAALVAADLVVGDHGSVTLLGAGLGTPVLLAAFGEETAPGTPVDELGSTVAWLDPAQGLHEQVDKAIASHDPRRYAHVTDRVFAHVGDSTRLLRDLLYRELDLTPPATEPALRRLPDVPQEHRAVTAFDVYAAFTDPTSITLVRYPRAARATEPPVSETPLSPGARHLAVDEEDTDLRLAQAASVITRRAPVHALEARAWTVAALRNYPGARLASAATATGCVVAVRDSGDVVVSAWPAAADPMVLASAVYCCLLAGRLDDGEFTLRAGPRTLRCRLTVQHR